MESTGIARKVSCVEIRLALLPVVGIALQNDVLVLDELDELERASADRVETDVGSPFLDSRRAELHPVHVIERDEERGQERLGLQLDGVGVDHLDRLERRSPTPRRSGSRD